LETPSEPNSGLLSRGRLLLVLGVFILELAILTAALMVPLDGSTKQIIANQTSGEFDWLTTATPLQVWLYIFSHNLEIALLEMVPVFGGFLFLVSIYSTGLATQVIFSSQGAPGYYGLVLFALPYSMVELSAYAIATGSGAMLLVGWRKKRLRKELRAFGYEALVVALVLLVASAMETVTRYSVAAGFVLWVPTGVAIAWLVHLARRAAR
jgi:uncharacterized membrane protein SpoIIM required for sporulation